MVVRNPSDFIGRYIGDSEANTKAILASTRGKVLVIDEAYSLYESASNGAGVFKTAVIDTIVAEVQSTANEDRCVLLLGYKDQMEEMFQVSIASTIASRSRSNLTFFLLERKPWSLSSFRNRERFQLRRLLIR